MARGDEHGGQTRRQPFSEGHLVPGVRPARVRVAEAQGAQHHAVAHQWNHQRGGRRELAMQPCHRAPGRRIVIVINGGAEHRLARADDAGDGAHQIVAADRPRGDERAHVAGEARGAVARRHASQRAGSRDVHQAEVAEAGQCFARRTVDNPLLRRQCRQSQSMSVLRPVHLDRLVRTNVARVTSRQQAQRGRRAVVIMHNRSDQLQ